MAKRPLEHVGGGEPSRVLGTVERLQVATGLSERLWDLARRLFRECGNKPSRHPGQKYAAFYTARYHKYVPSTAKQATPEDWEKILHQLWTHGVIARMTALGREPIAWFLKDPDDLVRSEKKEKKGATLPVSSNGSGSKPASVAVPRPPNKVVEPVPVPRTPVVSRPAAPNSVPKAVPKKVKPRLRSVPAPVAVLEVAAPELNSGPFWDQWNRIMYALTRIRGGRFDQAVLCQYGLDPSTLGDMRWLLHEAYTNGMGSAGLNWSRPSLPWFFELSDKGLLYLSLVRRTLVDGKTHTLLREHFESRWGIDPNAHGVPVILRLCLLHAMVNGGHFFLHGDPRIFEEEVPIGRRWLGCKSREACFTFLDRLETERVKKALGTTRVVKFDFERGEPGLEDRLREELLGGLPGRMDFLYTWVIDPYQLLSIPWQVVAGYLVPPASEGQDEDRVVSS